MKKGKIIRLGSIMLVLVVLIATTLIACAPQPQTSTQTGKPEYITVGGLTALSGPAAPWGVMMQNVWTMVADKVNASGGMNVKGKQYLWKLKVYDHELDYSKALTLTTRLISEDKALAIIIFDGGCIKSAQVATEPKKVIVGAMTTPGKDVINSNNFYTFGYGIDADSACVLYPWLEKNTNIHKVAIFQPDTWTGDATVDCDVWAIGQTKLEIVFKGSGDAAATDFIAPLTAILNNKPDILDVGNWDPATGALIIKQARQLGFTGALHLNTPDIPTLEQVSGWNNCEGAYLDPYFVTENDEMKAFKAEYIKKYGEENWVGPITFLLIDQLNLITEAIKGSQSLDTTDIMNYLATMKTSSILGSPCLMGGTARYGIARLPLYPWSIGQVQNGEVVQVISNAIPEALK